MGKVFVEGEANACETHFKVGKSVRNAIKEIRGTIPEELPTPEKSVKEIENEIKNKLIK